MREKERIDEEGKKWVRGEESEERKRGRGKRVERKG